MEPAQGLPFEVLEEITDGFSEERLLGTGAYGKVYKGIHKNGDEVVVKMVTDYDLDDWDFKELRNQMMLDHPNIVRVVAYCDETECKRIKYKGGYVIADLRHRALCLEYMHNGSLRKHLSDECDGLDWHTRYKIIKGTSEGLQYLHEGYTIPVYHMDLKPDNILLDRNMVPKLADFGLSPFGRDGSIRMSISSLITRVGTIGYLPPEYIRFGKITKKNDIFSLGVVMIKIIAGPRGRKRSAEMPPQEFIDQVQGNWRKRLQCTWSGSLLEAYCQQVKTCTEIALNCMEEDRHTRPSIAAIILSLNEMETMIEELKNDAESGLDEVHVTTTAPVEEAPVVVAAVQPTAVVIVETPKEEAAASVVPDTLAADEPAPAENGVVAKEKLKPEALRAGTETKEVEIEVEAVAAPRGSITPSH